MTDYITPAFRRILDAYSARGPISGVDLTDTTPRPLIRGEIVTSSTPTYDGVTLPQRPRVLARITNAATEGAYSVRCESCSFASDDYATLQNAARDARAHAVCSGHAVLVEAL